MSIEMWLSFVLASMVLLLIPGPTILTVISYSLSHGVKARIPLILAVALGDSTALALSLLGLGVLLAESAFWFQVIKWAGGLYLLYLAFQLFRAGLAAQPVRVDTERASGWKLFFNTYMVTALNPKGIVFFVAFMPQFIDYSANAQHQLWVLASTFVVLATCNAMLYALFAGRAQTLLSSEKMQKTFHFTGGSLLSIAGVWALTARHNS